MKCRGIIGIVIIMMERQVDKYPYKKILYLQWYEAAIANLILFKHLKERCMNNIYFLISEQGVLLKATSTNYLRNTSDEINKFFTAKIERLEVSASSDFYQNIMQDIKEQTDKLKDNRDCPYINLVYSHKLKNSCLALKKYGYSKPYEQWEIAERERRGFCYLIVRPEHRWKEIANNVMGLVKKREAGQKKSEEKSWLIELNYEKFVWLYLRPEFEGLKKGVEVKEKKDQAVVQVTFKKDITQYMQLERTINQLKSKETQDCPYQRNVDKKKNASKLLALSTLDLEKITELIYHEYGLPSLVREMRAKSGKYLLIGLSQDINLPSLSKDLKPAYVLRQDIGRLKDEESVVTLLKLGHSHDLVNYRNLNYVMVRFDLPLKSNIQNMIKHRLPCLPRYYSYFEKDRSLYLLRRYQTSKFKPALETAAIQAQVFLLYSLVTTVHNLHNRGLFVGSNFLEHVFVSGELIVIEPSEVGTKGEDVGRVVLLVREWVKGLPTGELKEELEKYDDPNQMLPIFEEYLNENYL